LAEHLIVNGARRGCTFRWSVHDVTRNAASLVAFRVLTLSGQSRTMFLPSIDLPASLGVVQHMNQHKDRRK
jgi:hypothetical protein